MLLKFNDVPADLPTLVVQATQYVFGGTRVVVLHEVDVAANGFFKLALAVAFKKETTVVAEDLWFELDNIRDGREGVVFISRFKEQGQS